MLRYGCGMAAVNGETRAKVLKQMNDQLTETKDIGYRGPEISI
jgi:hypothetical protein